MKIVFILFILMISLSACSKKEKGLVVDYSVPDIKLNERDDNMTSGSDHSNLVSRNGTAILLHIGTIIDSTNGSDGKYAFYSLIIRNLGDTAASGLEVINDLGNYFLVNESYENRCEKQLASLDECLLKISILKASQASISRLELAYDNGKGLRYLDIPLSYEVLVSVNEQKESDALSKDVVEPTPPVDDVVEPTPPVDDIVEPTPPVDDVVEPSPPVDDVVELSPPVESIDEFNPPQEEDKASLEVFEYGKANSGNQSFGRPNFGSQQIDLPKSGTQ